MTVTPQRWTSDLALWGVVAIWGVNIPVMKAALAELHPFAFNATRLSMSALALGVLARREQARIGVDGPTPWRQVVVAGLLGSLLYQVVFLLGMARTSAGNTGLLLASSPMWTAVIAWLWRIERLRRGAWLGLGMAFLGLAALTVHRGDVDLSAERLTGNILVLGAAFTWGAFTVLSKPVLVRVSPVRLAYLMTVVTLPVHIAIAVPHMRGVLDASPSTWMCVVFSGVLSTGLAYAWWNYGVSVVGPSHSAIYTNLVPVIALAGSWLWLGESVDAIQLTGGALVLGGLIAMRRAR